MYCRRTICALHHIFLLPCSQTRLLSDFWFEVFHTMLTIKCSFFPHRKWNTIKVNECITDGVAVVKHVGGGVGIVLWKNMSCSYHLCLFRSLCFFIPLFLCTSMIYWTNFTTANSFCTFSDYHIDYFSAMYATIADGAMLSTVCKLKLETKKKCEF